MIFLGLLKVLDAKGDSGPLLDAITPLAIDLIHVKIKFYFSFIIVWRWRSS